MEVEGEEKGDGVDVGVDEGEEGEEQDEGLRRREAEPGGSGATKARGSRRRTERRWDR